MLKLLAIALFVAALPLPASAQKLPLPIPLATASASPYGFAIKRLGNLDTAPVTYEGRTLFVIASSAEYDPKAVPPIVLRVDTIQDNLRRIVPIVAGPGLVKIGGSRFESSSFKVEIGKESGYPTLYATDARRVDAIHIMTITEADSALYGIPGDQLAIQWQEVLQTALAPVVRSSEPSYLQEQLKKIPLIVLGAVAVTALFALLRRRLRKRSKELDAEAHKIDALSTSEMPEARQLRLRLAAVNAALWLLTSCLAVVWILLALWALQIFPTTRTYAYELSTRLVKIVIIWFVIVLVNYALNVVIVRVSEDWGFNPFLTFEDRSRMFLRRPTIVRAIENLKVIVLIVGGAAWTLSILSISTASALTVGAIAAFALSFAAQSTIKDYVNGFLILTEDQFAIGDTVTINGITGKVENLTLRITQIRTNDGKLATIANSTINVVENATRS